MKLKDLFKNVSYKQIFNIIYKEYYKDKNHTKDDIINFDLAYRKAYEDLSVMPVQETDNLTIVLQNAEIDDNKFIDVCIKDSKTNEIFALDFLSWNEVANYDVELREDMENEQIAAHILWEITFWGFTETDIEKQKQATLNASDEDLEIVSLNELI
jgi:hypothetical protein